MPTLDIIDLNDVDDIVESDYTIESVDNVKHDDYPERYGRLYDDLSEREISSVVALSRALERIKVKSAVGAEIIEDLISVITRENYLPQEWQRDVFYMALEQCEDKLEFCRAIIRNSEFRRRLTNHSKNRKDSKQ